jgi:hypothetical protein
MSINWQDVITNIGTTLVSGTVVVGAAAWVAKTVVSDRLVRWAEEFKAQLKVDADAATERLRNSLQMIALEHQVRFSKLHEKRAEVIEQVYQQLVEAEKGYGRFVLVDGYATDPQKQREAYQKAQSSMYETSLFIEKHRIYLPAGVCESLKAFLDIMWENVHSVGVYGSISRPTAQTLQESHAAFTKGHEALTKEIPSARAALESEFRRMLGAEGHEALTKEVPSARAALESEFRRMLGAEGATPRS